MGVNRELVDRAEQHLVDLAAAGARLDPVPQEAFDAAVASFAWRTIDAELADLVFDSASRDRDLVGIRSTRPSRQLTFEAPRLAVELEIDSDAGCSLAGQLVPAGSADIEVRCPGCSMTIHADDRGRFSVHQVPGHVVSLRIRRPGGDIDWVTTPWVSLLSASAL
jgi:hypothetical protein